MNTTLQLKLAPSSDQQRALVNTMESFNAACNWISSVAYENGSANRNVVHRLTYQGARERFSLPAQLAVRAIAKVCEAYKRDKKKQPTFRARGSVVYDQRNLSFKGLDTVSILSVSGRLKMPVVVYGYAHERITAYGVRGQADLVLRDGQFYLCVVVDIPEPPQKQPKDWLGVDLGIVNIATDSDGENFSGAEVNGLRRRHASLRARLQSKGTRSATRRLKQQSGRESRFGRHVNHEVSRGFYQLASFVEYKAALAGVPFVKVDPRNTSRTCPGCGHVAKANRPTRDQFLCVSCGLAGPADHFAAVEIGRRAAIGQPYAAAAVLGLAASCL